MSQEAEILDASPDPVPVAASLAQRSTVRQLVATFAAAEAQIRTAFATIVTAELAINAVFTTPHGGSIHVIPSRYSHDAAFDEPDIAIERMRREAWCCIAERLELRRAMSIERWRKLEKALKEETPPELSEENVEAFARQHSDALPEMLAEAVGEVFEFLRPHNSRHKTNTELEIGRRIVLTSMVDTGWTGHHRVNHHRHQHLTALENVFSALDGKGSISKGYFSLLQTAIEAAGKQGSGETAYFGFRVFKNGNLHLEILRDDLRARFNQIAGGMRLRPAAA